MWRGHCAEYELTERASVVKISDLRNLRRYQLSKHAKLLGAEGAYEKIVLSKTSGF